MDVFFETSNGKHFSIEIGFFDTVLEIKEKVQKYEGFPVSTQKLVFNGQELEDDRDTEYYDILQNSRIHLALADQDSAPPPPPPPAKLDAHPRVNVVVNATVSKRQLTLDADATDAVGQLKARIQDLEGIPASRFVLFHGGAELQDHQTLADCGVADDPEVSLVVRPFPPSPPSSSAPLQGSKKLRLMVLPKCGTKKVPVDVNASDNVSELRKELQRLYGVFNFHLPTDGYFFIYKQNVMDEDKSFRWHDVKQGDTIEIFNGSVTGGS
ncbi:hypothetical protein OPV22_024723 [Ensete ventricosum]|uniref:Ubiquitin-like domain-containing protein n=1 Tax=Ensete ventricosum TaxID=4639 RepID=A0AAV8Q7V5_ENSVE|nr:hypothetical protein OPV22_024723 [Ensete ventricosum]